MVLQKRKLQLEVKLTNFGPIKEGRIELYPLTIFIGPNNSGKSYFSMLIHSILYNQSQPERFEIFFRNIKHFSPIVEEIRELLEKGETIDCNKEVTNKCAKEMYNLTKKYYVKDLSAKIIRSFSSPLKNLITIGQEEFILEIVSNDIDVRLGCRGLELEIESFEIQEKARITDKLRLSQDHKGKNIIHEVNDRYFTTHIQTNSKADVKEEIETFLFKLWLAYFSGSIRSIRSLYLPAARSGILQGHTLVASNLVDIFPYMGVEKPSSTKELFRISPFTGVVADFINNINNIPNKKGPFYKLGKELEKEIIRGSVNLQRLQKYTYPEIYYNYNGKHIPLHRTSSTVSEIAPIILYIKHYLTPNSVLIIEEPESHLHPRNQRILAKYLVKLIRQGVRILITTHSDYLVNQINNFILLGNLEKDKRRRYGYEDIYLKSNEVNLYQFSDYSEEGYHYINKIKISDKEGIDNREFLEIKKELYDEALKIEKDLHNYR